MENTNKNENEDVIYNGDDSNAIDNNESVEVVNDVENKDSNDNNIKSEDSKNNTN